MPDPYDEEERGTRVFGYSVNRIPARFTRFNRAEALHLSSHANICHRGPILWSRSAQDQKRVGAKYFILAHFASICDALFASIHDAHLQESTLVDTCLQYQISTTDLQVNLLCINLFPDVKMD